MKIIKFTAENIKRIKLVEITPAGALVQITGKNAAGKSSILDSIMYALGGMDTVPDAPIRRGANSARITLDLGDIIVTRSFTARGSDLRVEDATGKKFTSPQRILDELYGRLAFDPLEFSRFKQREQFDALLKLVPLGIDLDALRLEDAADIEARTEVNRRIKASQHIQAVVFEIPADTPDEPQSHAAASEALKAAIASNNERAQAIASNKAHAETIGRTKESIRLAEEVVKERKAALAKLATQRDIEIAEPIDTDAMIAGIEQIERINWHVKTKAERTAARAELRALETKTRELSERLDGRAKTRGAAMEKAIMPVPGLGFGDGIVTFEGLPLVQASSAEKLRVSVGIAMAANPRLRVLRIVDGSLLDAESLALIAGMAKKSDYQIWIEQVDDTGKIGVVISDGEVIADNQAADDQGGAI